jgi:hypothetical protein
MKDIQKLNLVPVTEPSSPSAPAPSLPAVEAPASSKAKPKQPRKSTAPPGSSRDPARSPLSRPWRQWSSFDRTVSYRLPPELITELEERLWELRLPIGVTVAAALADLLDKPNDELRELVDRAENAKPRRRPRTSA